MPDSLQRRVYGPLSRFDHHAPTTLGAAQIDPDGRAITYLARSMRTCAAEVFGETRLMIVCPNLWLGLVRPTQEVVLQDLRGPGTMAIGAQQSLAAGDEPRELTQIWARAIYEDRPAHTDVAGIIYPSAYDGGDCLALWETAPPLEVVQGATGRGMDRAVLGGWLLDRFAVDAEMLRIRLSLVGPADCPDCRKHGLY